MVNGKSFNPIPIKWCQFGTPCRFPFIWGMIFALNLRISRDIGLMHLHTGNENWWHDYTSRISNHVQHIFSSYGCWDLGGPRKFQVKSNHWILVPYGSFDIHINKVTVHLSVYLSVIIFPYEMPFIENSIWNILSVCNTITSNWWQR